MSRTIKKSKWIGYDYQSKRKGNKGGCAGYGPHVKAITTARERAEGKAELNKLKEGEE